MINGDTPRVEKQRKFHSLKYPNCPAISRQNNQSIPVSNTCDQNQRQFIIYPTFQVSSYLCLAFNKALLQVFYLLLQLCELGFVLLTSATIYQYH